MSIFKFYQSYIDLIDKDYIYRKNGLSEFDNTLKQSKFRNYLFTKMGYTYESILKVVNMMRCAIIKPQRLLTDNDNFYLACDMITNTYYICYRELMMIDIDFYKKSITGVEENNLEDIIELFMNDVKDNPDNCWSLYKTRGGIHAFLISKKMSYNSKESVDIMIKLKCDFNYIIYSYLRGWSVRLNRKQKEEKVITDFICQIGNPLKIDRSLVKLVDLHIRLIKVFENEEPSLMYGE